MFKSQERVCLATWFLTTCLALSLLISVVSGKLRDWFPGEYNPILKKQVVQETCQICFPCPHFIRVT